MDELVIFYLDNCVLKHECKQRITNLTLVINESDFEIASVDYTKNVYSVIVSFFCKSETFNYSCTVSCEVLQNIQKLSVFVPAWIINRNVIFFNTYEIIS